MQALSRRGFLTTASVLPAAAPGLLPIAAGRAAQASEPLPDIWAAGAKPDFVLSIERHEMAPFGTPIETLLAGGTWPGTPIRYNKGDQFRVLVENRLDQPTTLYWHGLIVPSRCSRRVPVRPAA